MEFRLNCICQSQMFCHSVPPPLEEYCDERVLSFCLFVSLSVRAYLSLSFSLEPHVHISPIFYAFCRLPWLGPSLTALRYVMCGTSGFVYDVIFSYDGPYWRRDITTAASL